MVTILKRRSFLTGAAATAAYYCLEPVPGPAKEFGPNEKLNLAFIGAGGKGETNVLTFRGQKQNIVAVCDVDKERSAKGFSLVPKAKQFTDYRKMLEEMKEIDAVIISIPDHSHAAASIMAMKLGKHVYTEKPMAHDINEVRIMRKVAAETGARTQMGNHGHGGPGLRRGVEMLQSGAIGKVREFHAWTDRPSWPQGIERPADTPPVPEGLDWNLWLGPAPERPYNPAYVPRSWRGWWDFGTGALGDMACHIMDLGIWGLKLESPVSIEAETSGVSPETAPKWSIITYEFPERGELPPVTLKWYDGGKQPDPALFDGQPVEKNGALLIGDEGKFYMTDTYGAKWKLLPEEKFKDFKGPDPFIPRCRGHYGEWIDSARGGPVALSNFDNAAPLTEAVLTGNLALRAGKKILWDGGAGKALNCPETEPWIARTYREGWTLG